MKIAINTLFITEERGGPKTYLLNLIRAFIELDSQHQFFLFVSRYNENIFKDYKNKIRKIIIPLSRYNRILRFLSEQIFIPYLIHKYGIDILYTQGNLAIYFCPCKQIIGIQGLLVFNRLKKKLRLDTNSRLINLFFKYMIPFSAKRADRIIVVSTFTKNCLLKEISIREPKIKVIYEGVDDSFLSKRSHSSFLTVKLNKPYILFVGILFKYKNVDKLIAAFSFLKKEKKIPHYLLIIGRDHKGYLQELKDLAKRLNMKKWIVFLGQLPHEALPNYYKNADLFVYPSSIESFGLPILEAMACGTPVIASNRTSIPEIVGDAGLIVDPDNIEELAEAIWKVLTDKKLRENLIKKGYERIKQFSWEKTAKETLKVFEEVYYENIT